jgi:hypothetical protein
MDVSPNNYLEEIPVDATPGQALEDTNPSMEEESPL